jgi:hypothetical protein
MKIHLRKHRDVLRRFKNNERLCKVRIPVDRRHNCHLIESSGILLQFITADGPPACCKASTYTGQDKQILSRIRIHDPNTRAI